jgi:hypothetical protein
MALIQDASSILATCAASGFVSGMTMIGLVVRNVHLILLPGSMFLEPSQGAAAVWNLVHLMCARYQSSLVPESCCV